MVQFLSIYFLAVNSRKTNWNWKIELYVIYFCLNSAIIAIRCTVKLLFSPSCRSIIKLWSTTIIIVLSPKLPSIIVTFIIQPLTIILVATTIPIILILSTSTSSILIVWRSKPSNNLHHPTTNTILIILATQFILTTTPSLKTIHHLASNIWSV